MKAYRKILALSAVLLLPLCLSAQDKDNSLDEYCAKEADRLTQMLSLEDWQTFYVDSTLRHDYTKMQETADSLSKAKVTNTEIYQNVHDKWAAHIDKTYERIFNADQWAKYLKMGGAKKIKEREKRMAKYKK